MSLDDKILERLKATQGDVQAQAAVMADLLLSARPESERQWLREALDAAAVLHWFNPGLLHQVLEIPQEDALSRFAKLKILSFVESSGRAESGQYYVHEATRIGWRRLLSDEEKERFRSLSARAAACFAEDDTASGRIEWIYHLLCGEPEAGATALESLSRQWSSVARPEDEAALAFALSELEAGDLVEGRARVWTLLAIAWTRSSRGESARLANLADEALRLARKTADERAEADAVCLRGEVLEAQGKLEAAGKEFSQFLAISQHLADQDPSNAGLQRELAVAHSRIGGVLQGQGKLKPAQEAFSECLAIFRCLAEQDPSNAGWQRELAKAHSRLGGVLQVQGKLQAAQEEFGAYLAISRRLAEQDPSNADWQHSLGVAHNGMGGVLQAQGKLEAAQAAFEECLAISQRLAKQDPSNASLQADLAAAHGRVGDVLKAQDKLQAAQDAYRDDLVISRRLAEQDPSNADWQHSLAEAHSRVGVVFQAQRKLEASQEAFTECLAIVRRLAEQDPSNPGWQHSLAVAHTLLGGALQAQDMLEAAQEAYREDLAISRRLAEQYPSNAQWQHSLAVAHSRLGGVLWKQGKLEAAREPFGECLAILRRLAEQDSNNAGWQRDLAIACLRLARLEDRRGDYSTALTLYEDSFAILSELVELAPGHSAWADDKKKVESELMRCRLRSKLNLSQPGTGDTSNNIRAAVAESAGRRAVLWVDDVPKHNSYLIQQLVQAGIHVDTALSTSEGMEMFGSGKYSVVVSDMGRVEAGGFNPHAGIDFLKLVRNLDQNVLFVIFTSSRGYQENRDNAIALGATFITSSTTEVAGIFRSAFGGSI